MNQIKRQNAPSLEASNLMRSGEVFDQLGTGPLDPACDRMMICGSMDLNIEIKEMLEAAGFDEGSVNRPSQFVLEKAFVG